MTPKYTPGPWGTELVSGQLHVLKPETLTYIAIIRGDGRDENVQADARLIAAAPDLFEACQEIIEGMIDGPNATQKNVTAFAIHKIRAAIAKTE